MPRRKNTNADYKFLIDRHQASLLEIIESVGDDNIRKSFLSAHTGIKRNLSADRYLKSKLGEYLSAHDIRVLTGIKSDKLGKYRKQGLLRAEKLNGRWYYSVESIVCSIKSNDY